VVLVPDPHHLINATTVKSVGEAADVVREMPEQRRIGRRQYQSARGVVHIAVEGLHHCEDELSDTFAPLIKFPSGKFGNAATERGTRAICSLSKKID
jgi:hypothetical protein